VLYIDTSVLLVYTLTQAVEKDRYPATEVFFARIAAGSLSGATSFYALHEVYVFALDNAPDSPTGAAFGKAALEKILSLPVQILPFVPRTERRLQARKFTALRDSSDVPHVIVASVYRCEAIVAYDDHF
jgi:predicted nucleic acid-binding protein